MSRYVVTAPVVITPVSYALPGRTHKKGDVIELNAAEVTAIGAGNLRAVSTTTTHETSGECFAVSNGF
jgi:hypothetical protein